MVVETKEGKVAIAGDLWWSERGPAKDPFASDQVELERSRQKISDLANFIIPGHGAMFSV
jgi:glyoxylase-like metal-dependent hydrolase (beta-lactamase superfamily II)